MPRGKTMPKKKLATARQARPHRKNGAVAKQALAQTLKQLGSEATNRDISQFMKKRFGIESTFVLIMPK